MVLNIIQAQNNIKLRDNRKKKYAVHTGPIESPMWFYWQIKKNQFLWLPVSR